MTAALEGGEWSAARPGRTLPLGNTWYPLYRSLGGPQGRSGWAEYLVPTGIRSRTVQPVVSRFTDWATQPTIIHIIHSIKLKKSSGCDEVTSQTLKACTTVCSHPFSYIYNHSLWTGIFPDSLKIALYKKGDKPVWHITGPCHY